MDNLANLLMAGLQAQAVAANPPPRNPEGEAPRAGRTLKERVRSAYDEGLIHCDNLRHFQFHAGGDNVGGVRHRSDAHIIGLMIPYARSACKCERDALSRVAWADQSIGTYQNRYVMTGADFVGCTPEPKDGVYKKVCPVPYQLEHAQAVELGKLYPGYLFYSYQTGKHDHPVAHTCTMMNSALATQALPVGSLLEPAVVIDISGNPAMNSRTNRAEPRRVIETCCKAITPKDKFREATKWGPQISADGTRRWHNLFDREIGAPGASLGPERMAQASALLSIHTLYYLGHAEVHSMLSRCADGAKMTALVHKFGPGAAGTVNNGEQDWGRKDGQIEQVNKASGERYTHADSDEMWFSKYSWVSGERALAWSVNYLAGDMWLVNIIKYDPRTTGEYVPQGVAVVPEAPRIVSVVAERVSRPTDDDVVRRDQKVVLNLGGTEITVPLRRELVETYSYLKKSMISKPRDAKMWKSHVGRTLLRSKTVRTSDGTTLDCHSEEMLDLAVASFWAGADVELAIVAQCFTANWSSGIQLSNVLQFGSHSATKSFISRYVRAAGHIGAAKDTGSRFQALVTFADSEIAGGNL